MLSPMLTCKEQIERWLKDSVAVPVAHIEQALRLGFGQATVEGAIAELLAEGVVEEATLTDAGRVLRWVGPSFPSE